METVKAAFSGRVSSTVVSSAHHARRFPLAGSLLTWRMASQRAQTRLTSKRGLSLRLGGRAMELSQQNTKKRNRSSSLVAPPASGTVSDLKVFSSQQVTPRSQSPESFRIETWALLKMTLGKQEPSYWLPTVPKKLKRT